MVEGYIYYIYLYWCFVYMQYSNLETLSRLEQLHYQNLNWYFIATKYIIQSTPVSLFQLISALVTLFFTLTEINIIEDIWSLEKTLVIIRHNCEVLIFTFNFVIDRQNQSPHVFVWIQTDLLKCFLLSSSRPEVFCKKGILRNFTKLIGKHPCRSFLFNTVAGLNLNQAKIPVNFAKFLRTPFYIEHLWWLLLFWIDF